MSLFLKPAPGLKVRCPATKRHLAAEGERKPDCNFWRRRIASGDVVVATPPAVVVQNNPIPDSAKG